MQNKTAPSRDNVINLMTLLIAETIFETLNPLYALHKKHEIGC